MKVGPITLSLWALAALLQFVLLTFLVRRRVFKQLPWFFTLVVVASLTSPVLILFSVLEWQVAYYFVAWANRGIQLVLGIVVIHELLRDVLYGYPSLRSLAAHVFWVGMVLALGGAAVAAANAPVNGFTDALTRTLALGDRSLFFLQVGLLLIVFGLVAICGISWRRLSFGIAVGFGIYASAKLALGTAYFYLGVDFWPAFVVSSAVAGVVKVAFWVAFAVLPEPVPTLIPAAVPTDLDRWNSALQEVLDR